jgi:hypothetical protein
VLDANGNVIFKNPKTATPGGSGGGLTPYQVQTTVNQIVNQFDNEPVVKNYNTIAEGYNFAKTIADKANPTSSDDQGLVYAFAKAMDPTSAVREGEYTTVQKYAQSLIQSKLANAARFAANVAFLTPEARKNMVATINEKYQASKTNYDNIYKEYNRRIADAKSGTITGSVTDYGAAYGDTPNTPAAPDLDSLAAQQGFDIQAARDAGYSDDEISSLLNNQ